MPRVERKKVLYLPLAAPNPSLDANASSVFSSSLEDSFECYEGQALRMKPLALRRLQREMAEADSFGFIVEFFNDASSINALGAVPPQFVANVLDTLCDKRGEHANFARVLRAIKPFPDFWNAVPYDGIPTALKVAAGTRNYNAVDLILGAVRDVSPWRDVVRQMQEEEIPDPLRGKIEALFAAETSQPQIPAASTVAAIPNALTL
ncbi:MAG: hypothetical protein SFW62_02245 [Alphaproteobacteria bacterium]|nr:hypothetical protein [Alphaproteobacteria bacterium]